MKYLPSIFHEDAFLAEYLSAFETVLVGSGNASLRSLEGIVAGIARYFSPTDAPEEFLPWLAGWMAFGLRADLSVGLQRDFMTKIISLYKKRGTQESMSSLLRLFTGAEPTILEGDDLDNAGNADWNVDDGFKDWVLDGKPEHAFGVLLSFVDAEGKADKTSPEIGQKLSIASALIDLEKPAHTMFYLVPVFPSLKLPRFSTDGRAAGDVDAEARSRIGFDTLLGTRSGSK